MARVWASWCTLVNGRRLALETVVRALRRRASSQLGRAWRRWTSSVNALVTTSRQHDVAARMIVRALNRIQAASLVFGFDAWRQHTTARKAEEARISALEASESRLNSLLAVRLVRRRQELQRVCFASWCGAVRDKKRARTRAAELSVQAIEIMAHTQVSRAWRSWVSTVKFTNGMTQGMLLVRRLLKRSVYAGLRVAFGKWSAATRDLTHQQHLEAIATARIARTVRRWTLRRAAACFATLSRHVEDCRRAEAAREVAAEAMTKAVTRMTRAQISRGWNTWAAKVDTGHLQDQRARALHRPVQRVRMNAAARGLRSWRLAAREIGREEELRQVASAQMVSHMPALPPSSFPRQLPMRAS